MFFQLHKSEAKLQCSGYDNYENAREDQGQAHSLSNALPSRKYFFGEDHNGKPCHRCDIHDAQGEEEDKEQPQEMPCSRPIRKAPVEPSYHLPWMKSRGVQHFARQTRLRGVSW